MANTLYGLFGGTFDPVHNGHLATVTRVADQCALERVYFIPAAVPPHRHQPCASAQQRLEMVLLALANHTRFEVDGCELTRPPPSYTCDTVKSLQARDACRRYCLILGVDAFLGLDGWYRWQELLDSIHFIVMCRPGWEIPASLPDWWQQRHAESIEYLQQCAGGKIYQIEVEPNPLSATKIRYGIAQGANVSTMMPHSVWNYICANKLYGA